MELFVFPLGHTVFYPSVAKPLNIFETRYVQMVKDSLAQNVPIAIGYVDEPTQEYRYYAGKELEFVRPVAGYGLPMILEERGDGSMLIFLKGQGKACLGKVLERQTPYIVCEAEAVQENLQLDAALTAELMTIHKVLIQWVEGHIPDKPNQDQFLENVSSPNEIVGCFASYLIADHDMQQLLLETNDINEKIHLVRGLISSGEVV